MKAVTGRAYVGRDFSIAFSFSSTAVILAVKSLPSP